ncbi:MAG: hypothetical protein WC968_02420 [Bacilli bacterium]
MSERLKELLRKGDIETLLKLTKNSEDPVSAFFYIAGLRQIGEYQIALSYISEHQMELYNTNAPQLIEWHIDILLELNELDQALNILKQYDTFPYFSLETNELITRLSDKVQKKRKEKYEQRHITLPVIEKRLLSMSEELMLSAVQYLDTYYHESYEILLGKVLREAPLELTKSLVLFLLRQKGSKSQFKVHKFDQIITADITKLQEPLNIKAVQHIIASLKDLTAKEKEVNFFKNSLDLFNQHLLFYYPLSYTLKDVPHIAEYLYYLTTNMMGNHLTLEDFSLEHDFNLEALLRIEKKYYFDKFLHLS